uniref:Uncharacterized protein n=1 Tax=Candidatus Kentrum sp. FM TaxID=2126340 RepID=A0A450SCD9_9GAMM|nr:MAG: hypothetical protein BECKFM1743C_GA0114222_100797 [Candidatus Kentron sp. FM]VFJ74724.1 MAG: hypothetical protein BECKFM1743A_GA0114220_107942 [Candidatus Kentron sp. FM]VFK22627.1 MAG: hypothetical protein BECKFM1743B_GA0114221_108722 [Candidatus Kentron sp. FM]
MAVKMCYLSHFKKYGFMLDEIIPFLAKHGIFIENVPEKEEFSESGEPESVKKSMTNDAHQEWKDLMALFPVLTEREIAHLFVDIDPYENYCFSEYQQTELSRWKSITHRAIQAGEIQAEAKENELVITPDALAEWCDKKGFPYPLPGRVPRPTTDAGLREELESCKQELEQWKTKAKALEIPNYLDPKNERYAPKLAAAIHAWQAVTDYASKGNPKVVHPKPPVNNLPTP